MIKDMLFQWALVILVVTTTLGQSGPQSTNELDALGATQFKREQRTGDTPATPVSSGPLPVFRDPVVLLDSPDEGFSQAHGNSHPLPSITSSSDIPSQLESITKPPSVHRNSNLYEKNTAKTVPTDTTTNTGPVVTDPETPLFLDSDDITLNRFNTANERSKSGADSIDNQRHGNEEHSSLTARSNEFDSFNTRHKNDDSDLANVQNPEGIHTTNPINSDEKNFGGPEPHQNNAIPPKHRLINSESGQTLLDFEPGRSSLHVSVPRPLQIRPAPMCTFPQNFGEDQFELSTSEFGYPKSIVQQALKDSVANAVLNMLTDIMYDGILATQVSSYPQKGGTQGISIIKKSLGEESRLFGSQNIIGLDTKTKEDMRYLSSPFGTLNSAFDQSDIGASENDFRLMSGFVQTPQNQNNINDIPAQDYNYLSKPSPNNIKEQHNATKGSQNEENSKKDELQRKTGGKNVEINPKPLLNSSSSPTIKTGISNLPTADFRIKSFNNNNGPLLQPSGSSESFLKSGGLNGKEYNIDRLFPPKTSDMFLDSPPSPVGGEAGATPFISYNDGKRSQNEDSPFNFDSKSLFGSLPSSPFRSALSGRSNQGSPFGSSLERSHSQRPSFGPAVGGRNIGSGDQSDISSFAPSNFATSTILFDSGTKIGDRAKSPIQANGKFSDSQFGFPRMLLRKKRQVEPEPDEKRVASTCSPTYKLLRQYKNYNGACFVVRPESQGVYFAECSNSPCSGCRFESGASRCTAERVPLWVWSYCEAGPNKGKVMPDRVQVSVTCSCKTTLCRSAIHGRK